VAIAAAIAHRPPLLVLDEPTSQLDPVAGDELIWLLRRLNEESGTAVVIAEHRLERCVAAADRVVALEAGRVAFDGAPDGFLRWATAEREVLATPAARLFSLAGLSPLPSSVKQARAALRGAGLMPEAVVQDPPPRSRRRGRPAVRTRGLWYEVPDGPAVLRGVDLRLAPGERVALMGRNGAGKSTLMRALKGLVAPTRGRVELAGPVALLMQNPGDYLVHEHVREELPVDRLAPAGLADRPDAHPRDLSGGERQRLALEIVLGTERPALVCLDEPTRGMDRAHKARLGERLHALAAAGSAVIVATHDAEFVADFATRVVLMGKGVTIADGPTRELLEGGWYFATEVARIVDGALTPEEGATLLRRELVA
jgi:energy-coupling factor transporter ATP-binding protein EcfA2